MNEKLRKLRDEVKAKVKDAVADSSNVAAAVNVGRGSKASVSSRQRVVHRDGETTTVTERYEHRGSDRDATEDQS